MASYSILGAIDRHYGPLQVTRVGNYLRPVIISASRGDGFALFHIDAPDAMSTAARGGRSSGRATAAGDATRGPGAAAVAAPPPAPLSSTLLPQQLVNLSTLVLVSRAAAETSSSTGAAAAASNSSVTHARQQPLDALSHLLTSYLSLAATQATNAANLAGRSRIAPWDVVTALSDIGYAGKRGLDELMHEASKGDEGVEPEAEQLRQLATALQGALSSLLLFDARD